MSDDFNRSAPVEWGLRAYLLLIFAFVFAPIAASFVFSFNVDRFPSLPLGGFSLVFDNTVMLSCSLPGAKLDKSELLGAVQTVAVYADQYDEILKDLYR